MHNRATPPREWAVVRIAFALLLVATVGLAGPPAAFAAPVEVGHRDFSFGTGLTHPTGEKPQSKLWFNDGSWWGVLFDTASGEHRIYRFDRANQSWTNTGTRVDERDNAKADALWDGSRLYVASAGPGASNSADSARVVRYSYNASTKKYALDPGFPVNVSTGGTEAVVLDKDTTGKLWVTYTQGSKVRVNRSLTSDATWGTPFVLPVTGSSVGPDDISAVVAYDLKTAAPQIGVMWSNQVNDAMYFASHKDGEADNVWQATRTAVQGPKNADDHINLKSLQADASGRVFAAIKTSLDSVTNPNPNAPQIFVSVLGQDGNFTNHVFGRVGDKHTRPQLVLDDEHRNLYVFATAPTGGGTIYYKKTSLDAISFASGRGTPFIQSSTDPGTNDATSSKQNVNSTSDLLILASDDTSNFYLHNTLDLGDPPPSDTTPPTVGATTPQDGATGVAATTNVDATFSEAMDSSTLTNSTFTLAEGGTATPVAAGATYDSANKKATLDPSADLKASTTYVATVKGGASGVKDVAGNPLTADKVWSFTTAGAPPDDTTPPETVIDSGPSGTVSSSSATFAFSSSEAGSAFECALDGAAFASCASPKQYADLADGSHTFAVRAIDAAGNADPTPASRTWTATTTTGDVTAPTVTAPVQSTTSVTLGTSTIPVKLTWSATDSGGIAKYELQQSTNGGAFSNVTLPSATATTITRQLAPGSTYRFQVRATDAVGNVSAWTPGPSFVVEARQETDPAITYVGSWTQANLSGAFGGSVKHASAGGSKATLSFTGSSVSWVSTKAPNGGRAEVWLDGAKVATVDLYASSLGTRRTVFNRDGLSPTGTHTLEVRALGTKNASSTGTRVDVDAFAILR